MCVCVYFDLRDEVVKVVIDDIRRGKRPRHPEEAVG